MDVAHPAHGHACTACDNACVADLYKCVRCMRVFCDQCETSIGGSACSSALTVAVPRARATDAVIAIDANRIRFA
jgi:hypothetical protein